MVITNVKYTKEFSYHGMSEWMGCEASIEPTENPVTAVLELREKMIAAFKETLSQAEPAVIQQDNKVGFTKEVLDGIDGIANCNTPDELQEYWLIFYSNFPFMTSATFCSTS
jgi:cell division protein FtsX